MMGYSAGLSNLNGGVVVFTGGATLQIVTIGTFSGLPTRFTMRFTRASNNAPIPITFDANGVSPGADVLATGDFKVNLLFEMFNSSAWGGDNGYRPVLDLYDALATPPGSPPGPNVVGPVMTGVTTGFYYTEADTGMSIEEHDLHVTQLFGSLDATKTRVQFMHDDWVLRWNGIQNQVQGVGNSINNSVVPTLTQIQQQVGQLVGQGTGNLATKSDVQNSGQQIQMTIMMIAGIVPCPAPPQQGAAECAAAKKISDLSTQLSVDSVKVDTTGILIGMNQTNGILIGLNNALQGKASQSSLDALSAKIDDLQDAIDGAGSPSLEMVVAPIDSQGSQQRRWIVKVSRDGALVGASLTRVSTARTGKGATVYANVTGNSHVVTLAPGVLEVSVDVIKDVTDGSLYVFEATFNAGGATLQGSALAGPGK
jgi:hypothetical protein